MSTYDGSRSARQSKRYSMSALYMSMTANEGEMQIEDDLAKGENAPATAADLASPFDNIGRLTSPIYSPESPTGSQIQNILPIEEELCPRKGRPLP